MVVLNAAAPTQLQNGTSLGWTGEVAPSFGLLTSYSLFNTPFDAEIGAIYLNQTSDRNNLGTNLAQQTHGIHLPLIFRYNFDERVGIGVGAYASIANGDITSVQNGVTSLSGYADRGIHNRDFGLLFSARASIGITPHFYVIIDGRYQHGLTNLSNIPPGTPGDYLNTRSVQAYLGLSYRFEAFNAAQSANFEIPPVSNRK